MENKDFIPRFFSDMATLKDIAKNGGMDFDDVEYLLWNNMEWGLENEQFFCDFTTHANVSIHLYDFCLSKGIMEASGDKKWQYKLTEYGRQFVNAITSSAMHTQKKYESAHAKRQRRAKIINELLWICSIIWAGAAIICTALAIQMGGIIYILGALGCLFGAIGSCFLKKSRHIITI